MNLRPLTKFELSRSQKVALADRLLAKAAPVIDFEAIARTFDLLEETSVVSIGGAINESRDQLIEFVDSEFRSNATGVEWVLKLKLRSWSAVRSLLREMAGTSFTAGRVDLRREATGSGEFAVSITPREAARFMDERMFWISGVMRDTLTKKAQTILMQAIKTGERLEVTREKLRDLFQPYVARGVVDGQVVKPSRLETIIRTNVTEAYNQGRLADIHDPDIAPLLEGVRYSAILDSRTTEICNFLDDKVFKESTPGLDTIAPPNHFNCRSVIVPVVLGEEVSSFSGVATIAKAQAMIKTGFGGDVAELEQLNFKEKNT